MKKLSLIFVAVFVLGMGAFAQCTLNTSNMNTGFTPNPAPNITQGVAYSQTVQAYVPTTVQSVVTIDSIIITSITGLPSGITYTLNPASGVIKGGANGAICYSGTTNAAPGTYNLVFNGTAVTSLGSSSLSSPPASTLFAYSFTVVAGAPAPTCDTIMNVTGTDTAEIFTFGQGSSGYLAGNNSYGDEAKAEKFTGTIGNNVTGAYLYFSVATINAADSDQTVAVNVYDATGAGGSPGNILATNNISLKLIALDVTAVNNNQALIPVYVPFYAAPTLAATDFFVGVVLPTTTGDTIALFSNSQSTATGRGWELQSDGNWYNWDSVYTSGTPYHSGMYVAAVVCPPAPPVAGFNITTTPCAGATIQFNDQTLNGATSWAWSFTGGSPATSTAQNPTVTFANSGSYQVTLIAVNGQGADTISHTLVIGANPAATVATTPATSSTSATGSAVATVSGGASPYTYDWSNGATGSSITNVVSGTYALTVVDANGCQFVDDTVNVTYVNGILQLSADQQVKVYPNPATDVLNLIWSQKSNAEVTVLDLNGNVISTFTASGDMKSVCNVRNLAAGAYLLRITDKTSNKQQSMLFSKF